MSNAVRFKQTNVPRQQGEQARLKVVQGPDYGAIYVITAGRATLGRGEDNDVIISDLKASRLHGEFTLTATGWIVKDKGSSNGIMYNGSAVREAKLKTGDTLTFGETTLEFIAGEAATMMLVAPPRSVNEIQAQQAALEAQRKKIQSLGSMFGNFGTPLPRSPAPAGGESGSLIDKLKKNPLLAVVLIGGVAALFFIDDDSKPVVAKRRPASVIAGTNLAAFLPPTDPATAVAVHTFFNEGFREYTHGNWARAKAQFDSVLMISPGHPMATLYEENCQKAIESDVKAYLERAKKGIDAGKLRDARGDYEAVLRLLDKDKTNPYFIEATDKLADVNKAIHKNSLGEVQ